jgi:hypothetical protein
VILKIVLKSKPYANWRKSTNEREGEPKKKFDPAFGQSIELRSVFKEASRNLIIIFLYNKGKNEKTMRMKKVLL